MDDIAWLFVLSNIDADSEMFCRFMRTVGKNFELLLVVLTDLHNIQLDAIKTSQFTQSVSMFAKEEYQVQVFKTTTKTYA